MNINKIVAGKLQHHVFFVKDMEESRNWYIDLFALNFSADNAPNSSAGMRIIGQSMNFMSFGFYHHDICFAYQPKIKVDNNDMTHMTFKLNSTKNLEEFKERLISKGIQFKMGRLLKSQSKDFNAIYFKDPNGHILEIIE